MINFEFRLPSDLQGMTATISVHDLQGRSLFSKEMAVQDVLNHFSWNRQTSSGGKYVATLKAGGIICSDAFIL